jgi:hypothetical protein
MQNPNFVGQGRASQIRSSTYCRENGIQVERIVGCIAQLNPELSPYSQIMQVIIVGIFIIM